MTSPQSSDQYPPEETQRRFEQALRAALNSPHQGLKDVQRTTAESKPKTKGKAAKPSPSEPS